MIGSHLSPSRLRAAGRRRAPGRAAANRRLEPGLARRRRRRALALACVPLGGALVFLACRAAVQGGVLRVREVSFRGLAYARPSVLAAEAGLIRSRWIFDDFSFVPRNLARDPLIRTARVRRDPPGRLVVEVEERVPVAYWAADSTMWPLDAEGRVLPLDPALYGWDLPVLMASDRSGGSPPALQEGRLVDGDARALLRLVIGIRDRVPEVSRRVSTAEVAPGGQVALRLMGEGGDVRLRLETPLAKVALLPEVLRDLELKREGFESLDLSYEDQIVVRPLPLSVAPDSADRRRVGDVERGEDARGGELAHEPPSLPAFRPERGPMPEAAPRPSDDRPPQPEPSPAPGPAAASSPPRAGGEARAA